MKEIKPQQMSRNVFDAIGKDWMLVAAEADGRANAMTASWGGMGVLWNKCVAFVFIRPQRFTKTLIDKADTLSLSFFADDERAMLTYMGRTSGRDEDKLAKQNLTYSQIVPPNLDKGRLLRPNRLHSKLSERRPARRLCRRDRKGVGRRVM